MSDFWQISGILGSGWLKFWLSGFLSSKDFEGYIRANGGRESLAYFIIVCGRDKNWRGVSSLMPAFSFVNDINYTHTESLWPKVCIGKGKKAILASGSIIFPCPPPSSFLTFCTVYYPLTSKNANISARPKGVLLWIVPTYIGLLSCSIFKARATRLEMCKITRKERGKQWLVKE